MPTNDRWGCFDRPPFAAGYWAPNRIYMDDGSYLTSKVFIPDTNIPDCKSKSSRATDPKCAECKHITEES